MSLAEVVETRPLGYRFVSGLCRFLLRLFYQRIDVVGAEHIPPAAPLVVAANHHNSVVDAMLLVAFFPRRLRTLANAPLFQHPLIGPFLRLLGALPVHRRQEAGNDPARNAALFAATSATLQAGGAIMIFPEGRTQPEPVLLELRTGAARMLLAAQAPGAALLPVGLVFHEPGTFRDGRALLLVGQPLRGAGSARQETSEAEREARLLTERLATALRGLIVEADDRETLRLLGFVEELWSEAAGAAPAGAAARVAWLQRVMCTYRTLQAQQSARVAELRARVAACALEMERAGLAAAQLSRDYTLGAVLGFALREGLVLSLAAPLALCGILVHALPYQVTDRVVARMRRTDEEEATDKIAAGLVFYPLCWLLEAGALFALAGGWAAFGFTVALLPLGFFALAWRARLERASREGRAFLRTLRDRELPRRLRAQRLGLVAEMAELARQLPEVWAE